MQLREIGRGTFDYRGGMRRYGHGILWLIRVIVGKVRKSKNVESLQGPISLLEALKGTSLLTPQPSSFEFLP